MPQNEFNSAQWYPSNTWTPTGLSKFIAQLGPEMKSIGSMFSLGRWKEKRDVIFRSLQKS